MKLVGKRPSSESQKSTHLPANTSHENATHALSDSTNTAARFASGDGQQITPQQALALQSVIGNQAVQRLLQQSSAEKAETPAPEVHTGDQEKIRRKVGFEFESADWYAWTYEGGTPNRGMANTPGFADHIRPTKRQVEPLHVGTNFELQGDDTPGPTASNIEFVTSPFATETNQLDALNAVMASIIGIANVLGKFKDRTIKQADPADRYGFPEEHGLNRPDKLISSATGSARTRVKMQATSGIRLEDVPQVMQYFSKSVENESLNEQRERAPARSMMNAKASKDISLGRAPVWAQSAVDLMRKAYHQKLMEGDPTGELAGAGRGGRRAGVRMPTNPFSQNTGKLVGFLSIVMAYLNNMAQASGEELKYWQPLLARNNFAAMLDGIDPAQRAALHNEPFMLVSSVLNAINTGAGLSLGPGSPVAKKAYVKESVEGKEDGATFEKVPVLQDVTISRWLLGLAGQSLDILNRDVIAIVMKYYAAKEGRDQPSAKDIERNQDYLESQGINNPDQATDGDILYLFENRGITDTVKGTNDMELEVARALAISYLMFFTKIESVKKKEKLTGKEPGSQNFGQFPRTGQEK